MLLHPRGLPRCNGFRMTQSTQSQRPPGMHACMSVSHALTWSSSGAPAMQLNTGPATPPLRFAPGAPPPSLCRWFHSGAISFISCTYSCCALALSMLPRAFQASLGGDKRREKVDSENPTSTDLASPQDWMCSIHMERSEPNLPFRSPRWIPERGFAGAALARHCLLEQPVKLEL